MMPSNHQKSNDRHRRGSIWGEKLKTLAWEALPAANATKGCSKGDQECNCQFMNPSMYLVGHCAVTAGPQEQKLASLQRTINAIRPVPPADAVPMSDAFVYSPGQGSKSLDAVPGQVCGGP
jgi:hypothetical protein